MGNQDNETKCNEVFDSLYEKTSCTDEGYVKSWSLLLVLFFIKIFFAEFLSRIYSL